MDNDYYQQAAANQQLQEQMKIIKEALAKMLDRKARERLANIKLVKPEMATQLELYLFQLYQSGQLKQVTDEQIVQILKELGNKRKTNIIRK